MAQIMERRAAQMREFMRRRRSYIDALPKIECACGCGMAIPPLTKSLKPRRYASSHSSRGRINKGQTGPANPAWKGGRRFSGDGYVEVYVGLEHPLARSHGYAAEHRLVMAEKLGRSLVSGETVHHINGDRADNRPENLELRQGQHGRGVALRCCDCGSHNVEAVTLAQRAAK